MLKEIFDLIKENAAGPVINNPQVPNEQNDAVVAEATNTVASGLRNMVAGGGLQSIISLFNNNGQGGQVNIQSLLNNPMVNMMIGHLTGKLTSKYNLGSQEAGNVASNLIPEALSNLINKTNDPGNSTFSIESLLNSITGGQSNQVVQEQQPNNDGGGLMDIISQFSGNSQDGGGGLMDIVSKFAGGARTQQQKNGSGGLMDLIQGFLK